MCRVDQVDYSAPSWVRGAAASACVCGGLTIAALLAWSLGDPTWSISSGIGALFAAAIFEVGGRDGAARLGCMGMVGR